MNSNLRHISCRSIQPDNLPEALPILINFVKFSLFYRLHDPLSTVPELQNSFIFIRVLFVIIMEIKGLGAILMVNSPSCVRGQGSAVLVKIVLRIFH